MSVALFTFYGGIMASTATVAINHQKQGSENFLLKYFSTFFIFFATICLVPSKYFLRLATGKFYVCGSVHILWGHYGVNSNCCNQPSKTGFGNFLSLGKKIYDSVPGLRRPYLPSPPWVTQH
jgi:hypothetical protein